MLGKAPDAALEVVEIHGVDGPLSVSLLQNLNCDTSVYESCILTLARSRFC